MEAISGKFEPEKYHDEYRARVMDLIKQKSEGKEVVIQSAPRTSAPNVLNLMDALKASIAASAKNKKAPAASVEKRSVKAKAKKSA